MGQVTHVYKICDYCGGTIPPNADCCDNVNGELILGGQTTSFNDLAFCCSQHLSNWVLTHPQVPCPTPPYPAPPNQPPIVIQLLPSSGSVAGGTVITIKGTGFTKANAVLFGSQNATDVQVQSDTQIVCTSPSNSTGNAFVSISTPNGSGSSSMPFSYS